MPVKALSIRQPWAELIISGKKGIEIRSWSTSYRGRIYVHVSQAKDKSLEARHGFENLPTGAFVGYVDLKDIVPFTSKSWKEWKQKHHGSGSFPRGTYAWVVGDPVRFKTPIEATGRLSLFEPSPDLIRKLQKASL